jgi:hypothetical protein
VLSQFGSLIPGQRPTQLFRHSEDGAGDGVAHCLGTMSGKCGSFLHAGFGATVCHGRQMQQDGETCGALHQGADRGTSETHDEVSFPVARHSSIGGLRRTLADHDLGRNEGSALLVRALPRHPQCPPGTQAGRQFTAQRSSTLHIKCLIDRLVTDAHRLILGEIEPKATSNLFRAPRRRPASVLSMYGPAPLPHDLRANDRRPIRPGDHTGKPVLHIISQDRINRQLRRLWASGGLVGVPLCRGRPIFWSAVAGRRIALQLTRDRA